ncbi:MAG: ABC-type spermidine/putrescine transport system permease component II [Erysipelotrichaceae bacterium]|nr:MAG: ABC-type spermidine/putrescine transport system permease component [Erysipelotrichaceae bacterium]TXT18990.1 MAG: ABC-type spermidine/putrescine transport system permease component II [Erysipelotrichaceae bacterium]
MKKIVFSILLASLALNGCQTGKPTLKVFSWGAYIDETVIEAFEEEYDCVVIYDMFESNEAMYTKLLSGEKYDVLVPSDYMVQRLIEEDRLKTLIFAKLPNASGIISSLKGWGFDPQNTYSVPYFWGNVGLIYNTTIVNEEDLNQGWEILRNTTYKGQIYVYDSERDAFMVALKALGFSANTKIQAQLDAAYDWLETLDNTMNPVYATDDVIDNMIQGNKAIAMVYSGDAAYITMENPDMAYYVPEQGTNFWIDNMVISKNTKVSDLAHKWINFMLDPEVAELNSVYVGYSSPIQSVFENLKETEFEGLNAYSPRFDHPKDEVFKYDETIKKIISDLWVKVKAN